MIVVVVVAVVVKVDVEVEVEAEAKEDEEVDEEAADEVDEVGVEEESTAVSCASKDCRVSRGSGSRSCDARVASRSNRLRCATYIKANHSENRIDTKQRSDQPNRTEHTEETKLGLRKNTCTKLTGCLPR